MARKNTQTIAALFKSAGTQSDAVAAFALVQRGAPKGSKTVVAKRNARIIDGNDTLAYVAPAAKSIRLELDLTPALLRKLKARRVESKSRTKQRDVVYSKDRFSTFVYIEGPDDVKGAVQALELAAQRAAESAAKQAAKREREQSQNGRASAAEKSTDEQPQPEATPAA